MCLCASWWCGGGSGSGSDRVCMCVCMNILLFTLHFSTPLTCEFFEKYVFVQSFTVRGGRCGVRRRRGGLVVVPA